MQTALERIAQFGFDLLSIIVAARLAPTIAAYAGFGVQSQYPTPFVWPVITGWLVVSIWLRVHQTPDMPDSWDQFRSAARSAIALGLVLVTVEFFSARNVEWTGRVLAISWLGFCLALFVISRFTLQSGIGRLTSAWRIQDQHVAVVGYDGSAISMLEHLRSSGGGEVRGLIVPEGRQVSAARSASVLGSTLQLAEVINREKLDRIVILSGCLTQGELETCTAVSSRMGVTMSSAVAVATGAQNLTYSFRYGIPLVEVKPVHFTTVDRLVKRAFDMVGSCLLLLLLAPVMAAIAFLVKATSDGPIFYKAARVGRGGRYFTFLKFRSMYANAGRVRVKSHNQKDGHIFKMKNDPRVTPLGAFLRRYSLDELPQLINVILGDMSLVGPRPLPIEDMDPDGMSGKFAIWSEQRATVPPGITGMWQIRGRSELSFAELIQHDLEYVHNWSLSLDLKILMETPRFVLSGKGAY